MLVDVFVTQTPLLQLFSPSPAPFNRGPDRIERPLGGNGIAQKF